MKCVHATQYSISKPTKSINCGNCSTSVASTVTADLIERDNQVWLDNILNKVEGNIAKSNAAKQQGGKKRHSYTAKFKAEAIYACEEGDTSQETVAKTF